MIAHVALGVAICEADLDVMEEGGNNRGPRVMEHLANVDPPINIAVPWCAAAVQAWSDIAARAMGLPNPLDEVRLEAYVQSYYDWAYENDKIVSKDEARAGDLVLYKFGKSGRWDHIGILATKVDLSDHFRAVEGNTPIRHASEAEQRDSQTGDGVAVKVRRTDRYPVKFVRWDDE